MATSAYYQLHKERIKQRVAHWAKNNPDVVKEIQLKWRKENRTKLQQYQDKYRKDNPEKYLFALAKRRAKRKGLEFSIDLADIVIPAQCPLLEIEINSYSVTQGNRPSIDRIDSTKGYIKENVWVISQRANMLKNNATIDELAKIVINLMELT